MVNRPAKRTRVAAIAGLCLVGLFSVLLTPAGAGDAAAPKRDLTLSWEKEILIVRGKHLPGGALEVWYIEAFCRPGSTKRDWNADRDPPQDRAG